jgi:hypothetical protein
MTPSRVDGYQLADYAPYKAIILLQLQVEETEEVEGYKVSRGRCRVVNTGIPYP